MNYPNSALVTGAGGFIGGHLVKYLKKLGVARIRAVDIKPFDAWWQVDPGVENVQADLSLKDAADAAVKGMDWVFNLASNMGGIGFITQNQAECMLNVLINAHLLQAARNESVSRFFFSSSACIYNTSLQRTTHVVPLKESDAFPADPEGGYGWEKFYSEHMCGKFRQDFGLETRVARYHNIYGPYGSYNDGREKAPAAICRKIALAKISGKHEIEIWGDGEQLRTFTFIDDCLEGSMLLTQSNVGDPLNLGSDEVVSINQLVSLVEGIAGIKVRRSYKLDAPKGVMGRSSDNTLIREKLNWEPSIRLAEGLVETYRWIYDQMVANGKELAV